jgi:hypothetical protein
MLVDALGKWSLIDCFVLTLFMVAFHFHLELSEPGQTQYPPTTLDVFVNPDFGFYLFLVATVLSLFLTHVLLHYQRAVAGPPAALSIHGASVGGGGFEGLRTTLELRRIALRRLQGKQEDSSSSWRRGGLVPTVLAGSALLQLVGASVYSFSFTFGCAKRSLSTDGTAQLTEPPN